MAKETLPWGPWEWKGLHWKMNDVAKTTQWQIVKVAEDDTEKTEWAVFEKINLLSWIDEEKLAELQKADLVLVYRDNNTYRDMSSSLENLVENKYGKRVYCVSIPQWTENISDNEMELLKKILNTCHCMTDNTISNWTWIECPRLEVNERKCKSIQRFLWIIEKLENKFEEEWIDTVYVYVSWVNDYGGVSYSYSDHWSMYQRKNWSIYYDSHQMRENNGEVKARIKDLKRFWKNRFPNLNVEFIENFHRPYYKGLYMDFRRYKSEWIILLYGSRGGEFDWFPYTLEQVKSKYPDFDVDFYKESDLSGLKSEWVVLIADRHTDRYLESFWCQKIFYWWANFEPGWGIEKFLDEEDVNYVWNAGEAIAKTIMLNAFGSGDKPEK